MNTIPRVADLERAHGVTWGQLAGLEPQLTQLLWQAREAGAGCHDQADVHRAFAPFRDALAELVGLRGKHRNSLILGSVGAYEVAYWRVHEAVVGLLSQPASTSRSASEDGNFSVLQESEPIRNGSSTNGILSQRVTTTVPEWVALGSDSNSRGTSEP